MEKCEYCGEELSVAFYLKSTGHPIYYRCGDCEGGSEEQEVPHIPDGPLYRETP